MSEKTSSGGIGCLTVVGIVFVVLKCLSVQPVAGWSWWWVLAPFWLPAAAGAVVFLCLAAMAVLCSAGDDEE